MRIRKKSRTPSSFYFHSNRNNPGAGNKSNPRKRLALEWKRKAERYAGIGKRNERAKERIRNKESKVVEEEMMEKGE